MATHWVIRYMFVMVNTGLVQPEARSWELNQDPPRGWQGPNHVSHNHCLSES